jgi:hypothetical protein
VAWKLGGWAWIEKIWKEIKKILKVECRQVNIYIYLQAGGLIFSNPSSKTALQPQSRGGIEGSHIAKKEKEKESSSSPIKCPG